MLRTNIQVLNYVSNHLKMILPELVYNYLHNEEFKSLCNEYFDNINSRRVPNGLEKVEVNQSVIDYLNTEYRK